ncbi:bifunctional diguanylate cyclase/phosphodiesterase [Roseofilum capinflatum]|uniref:EAL domain-containing protein n=1 Tax=Roseofilum capinflatum BLCC-M114 TaxID=3022440 RepID=A0ABT7B191_9CYAN|nr:EAL domain-containing protein [Roseofilum capinflatum]MDJ1172597.1 EAL domain-containing protein [Roseofilum capinflatum BLCC-M114]
MHHRLLVNTPLRIILIVPFVIQITAAVGLTAWLSIRNGQKAVDNVADDLWNEIAARTVQHINEYTQIPQNVVLDTLANAQLNLVDITDKERLTRYLWHQMHHHPGLFITAVGYETGEVVGVGVTEDGQWVIRAIDPGQTQLHTYVVSGQGDRGKLISADDFDLKSRPWYRDGVRAKQLTWTDIYPNYNPPFNILSAVSPIYDTQTNQLIGVTNATLSLWQISHFLEQLKIGRSGEIFILDNTGDLVASSTGEPLAHIDATGRSKTPKRLKAVESSNLRVRQAAEHLIEQFGPLHQIQQGKRTEFITNGQREIVRITPFSDDLGLDWLIVIVVPESDFMAQIDANTRNTLWLSLGALVLATGSSIMTARWITEPLLRLNQVAKDIAENSLPSNSVSGEMVTNRTRELSQLSRSFEQMTQQLQASFAVLQESEANFKNMAANVPGAIFRYILHPDGTDTVLYMSPGCYQLWEIEADVVEKNAKILWDMVDPEDFPAMQAAVMKSAQRLETWNYEWRITTPSGRRKWLEGIGQPTQNPDGSVLWHTLILDVSDRKAAQIQLQDLTNRLELATRSAQMGIWEWDLVSDRLIWDDRMYELYGISPGDFSQAYQAWEAGVHPDDLVASRTALQETLNGEKDFNSEFRVLWPDGTVRYIEAHAIVQRDAQGQALRMIGVNLDISDRKQAEEQLIYSVLHDKLTDLPNRTLLTNRLELSIQRAQRSPTYHFAVLFLDLDQFKVINDSLGHLVGDQLLLIVAQKLQRIIRPTDLAARLGGDEFVILIEQIPDLPAIVHVAERLLAEFNQATAIDGHTVFITTSIGIVWGTNTYTEASDLLRDADIALYRAKAKGRNRYEIFDVEMHVQAVKRMTLEHDLRVAIARQEFMTYYQPIVDLKTRQLTGFESLIRWQHPMQGFISPTHFIPIAEETGLIVSISQWVLQSACEQVARWQRQFPNLENLRISINLSGQDLRQPNLVETIRQTLTQAQLPATSLTLEITESLLIENIETTINLLKQLRNLGIRISIDDFGTGYSSLSYLYNLPADYLKIDQSFVGKMQPGEKNYKIVQAVVSLSDQLQLGAIAEGIEMEEQLAWLKALGCELGQGYLFSRPLTPTAATDLLATGRTF